jgi:predicted RNase H-like HicB family nuclease
MPIFEIYDSNISGDNFSRLLDDMLQKADSFSFVVRYDIGSSAESIILIEQAKQALSAHLLKHKKTNEWLSTKVYGSKKKAEIFYYSVNKESIDIIRGYSTSLFDWGDAKLREPELPDDLTFYKNFQKNQPLLYGSGHENWFAVEQLDKEHFNTWKIRYVDDYIVPSIIGRSGARTLEEYLALEYPMFITNVEVDPNKPPYYVGKIKEFKGFNPSGETIEEVYREAKFLKEMWIRTAFDEGKKIPLPPEKIMLI